VIAAGFDSGQLPYKKVDIRREPAASSRAPQMAPTAAATGGHSGRSAAAEEPAGGFSVPVVNGATRATSLDIDDELDVPDFLK
jgi:cell division protein FtsZ